MTTPSESGASPPTMSPGSSSAGMPSLTSATSKAWQVREEGERRGGEGPKVVGCSQNEPEVTSHKTTHQFVIEVSIVSGEGAKISSVAEKDKERGKF